MSKKLTTVEFIKRARNKHGNKYDYSESIYTKSIEKVIINCPEHGQFQQTAKDHMSGNGCGKCGKKTQGNRNSFSQKEFIKRAIEVHGNKYDYRESIYSGCRNKINIICPKHGPFQQNPKEHFDGSGCRKCGTEKRVYETYLMHSSDFIKRARNKHGNKYEYSLVAYTDAHVKVIITCKLHGSFSQSPHHHLEGHGCLTCAGNQKKTLAQFIKQAIEVHGDKYIYNDVIYVNYATHISIKCKLHGFFSQAPSTHLKGCGCPKCGDLRTADLQRFTLNEFITRAKKTHGDTYEYGSVIYEHSLRKVNITCKIHGIFSQTPSNHLLGRGCPICKESVSEKKITEYIKKKGYANNSQKKFKECCNKRELPFDNAILIPGNLDILIEFDGVQHFESVKFFGGESKFKTRKKCDILKNKFCLENNKVLLRIAYTDINFIETLIDTAIRRSKEKKSCILFSNPLLYKITYILYNE